jgi:hypothetical protein
MSDGEAHQRFADRKGASATGWAFRAALLQRVSGRR